MDMTKAISLTTLLFVCLDNLGNDGHEIELFELPSWISESSSKILVNVDAPAAVSDGISDDTQVTHTHIEIHVCIQLMYMLSLKQKSKLFHVVSENFVSSTKTTMVY